MELFCHSRIYTTSPFQNGDGSKPLLFNPLKDISSTSNVGGRFPRAVRRLESRAEKARADLGDRGRAGSNQRLRGIAKSSNARYAGDICQIDLHGRVMEPTMKYRRPFESLYSVCILFDPLSSVFELFKLADSTRNTLS